MYNENLEGLIDAALADGVLTEKEKQILFKKAASMGIDLDEFEMVLDARLVKLKEQKQSAQVAQTSAPKSEKFGDVRKCPACGAMLQSFQTSCPECGHEFRNVASVNSAKSLFDLLQAVELRKADKLSAHDKEKSARLNELSQRHNSDSAMSKLIGENKRKETQDEEREDLIREFNRSKINIEKQAIAEKGNIIKNFPVPNSKEDLLELLAMATSNAYDNDGVVGAEEEVWIQKTDQIYQKIIVCASNDKLMLAQATNMVFSLMKRLPAQYRNFTRIPVEMKGKLEEEMRAEKSNKNSRKMQVLKKRGVPFIICIVVGIISFLLSNLVEFALIIALLAFGGAYYFYKKYKEDIKDIDLFN